MTNVPFSKLPPVKVGFCDIPNAGDQFNLDLFRHYGFNPEPTAMDAAEVVSTGSILGWQHCNFNGAIMGAGFMHAESSHPFNRAAVLAVRGKLSMERVFRKKIILGDPGLLVNLVYKEIKMAPTYALGVIPHHSEMHLPAIENLKGKGPSDILLIDICKSPLDVVKQIAQCAVIASSSLHGLIFADAFEIPTVWVHLSDNIKGGRFKFADYYSVFGESPNAEHVSNNSSFFPLIKQTKTRPRVALTEVRGQLNSLYLNLGEILDQVLKRRQSRAHQLTAILRNRAAIAGSKRFICYGKASRPGIPPALGWLP